MPNWKKVILSGSNAVLAEITASRNLSGSGTATASYGLFTGSFGGDGSQLTNVPSTPFPFTGDALITGSLIVSQSYTVGDTDSTALRLIGSGSVSQSGIFEVEGSAGPLFSVADGLDGVLMEVNNISGLPLLQVSSSNEVFINRGNLTSGVTTATASFAYFTGSFAGDASGLTNVPAGSTPTLDAVTTQGNVTSNAITAGTISGSSFKLNNANALSHTGNVLYVGNANDWTTIELGRQTTDEIHVNGILKAEQLLRAEQGAAITGSLIVSGSGGLKVEGPFELSMTASSGGATPFSIKAASDLATDKIIEIKDDGGSYNLLQLDSEGALKIREAGNSGEGGGIYIQSGGTTADHANMYVNGGTARLSISSNTNGAFTVVPGGQSNGYLVGLTGKGTMALGQGATAGTKPSENNTNTLYIVNGTNPTNTPTDGFALFSKDVNSGAGTASPTFLTEDDITIQLGVTSSLSYVSASAFKGDGSQLTNLPASDPFPFTGDAQITGSLTISGSLIPSTNPPNRQNVVIGQDAALGLVDNASFGITNVIVGYEAAHDANQLNNSVLLGWKAGYAIDNGTNNIGIGKSALGSNTSRGNSIKYNIGVGEGSGANLQGGTNGNYDEYNILMGIYSGANLYSNDGNYNNILIGHHNKGLPSSGTLRNSLKIGQTTSGNVTIFPISASLDSGSVLIPQLKVDSVNTANSASGTTLSVEGSGSTVFEVIGSEGTLFSIDDDLDGTIFTANDRTGLPVLEASASGEVYIGKSPQSLYTTAVISSNNANVTQSIYGLDTSSYGGAFFEYTAHSGSNARAGNIMSVWNGSSLNFTETTTTDIGSTSDLVMKVHISQSQAQLAAFSTNAGYNIKTIIKSI